jgi:quinol monooxygenase YgiN
MFDLRKNGPTRPFAHAYDCRIVRADPGVEILADSPTKELEAGAASELLGIARFKFHEGKLEEYKRLSAQAMEIVRTKDTGTLQFDVYFNDDESECMVIERYRDSEAAIEHAANLGDLFGAVLATVSVVHGELLGEASEELRAKLAGSEVPVLFRPYLSM